jgi:hypothetical protein
MEGLLILALGFTFIGGVIVGTNTATTIVRQETIYRCVQKPQECKKEFEYYQLKKEVETMKENQK